ncbi:unnamed protein product [Clavelina lepadiformis]|uniref:Uncharacterized protein n=1 Tax=Clavelina lepadiformis TaxID=159417 RepID=A0ABP0FJU1_CLALP
MMKATKTEEYREQWQLIVLIRSLSDGTEVGVQLKNPFNFALLSGLQKLMDDFTNEGGSMVIRTNKQSSSNRCSTAAF